MATLANIICCCPLVTTVKFQSIGIHCNSSLSLGPVADATYVLQPRGLLYNPIPPLWLVVPTFAARCLHACKDVIDPSSERWNYVGKKCHLGIFYMP